MDPRFGGNFGGMQLIQPSPQSNYLQRQLQRFGSAVQQGGQRLKDQYYSTDYNNFGGNLPFGAPRERGFIESLPKPGNIYQYGMPGVDIPEPAGGADFIGPRSNEILRRGIEQRELEKYQQDQRYSSPGDLSMMMPGTMMAGAPRYIQSPPPGGIINKAPHLDSPYIDKALERRWQPMAPPPRKQYRGPQLPSFV